MFNRQRSRKIEDFATSLARGFAQRVPPEAKAAPKPGPLGRAIDEVCNRAAAYHADEQLGLYGKARFGTAFKLELKQLGYSEEFIDSLIRQLLLTMSGK
jgi:hypothetical protein